MLSVLKNIEAPSENQPEVSDVGYNMVESTLIGKKFGFSSFMWYMPNKHVPFAYRFLRSSDIAYWQKSDPAIIWQFTRNNKVLNVENYSFILE
jgi:hypothetical protein